MKITLTKRAAVTLPAGTAVEVADEEGKLLVLYGRAVKAEPEKAAARQAAPRKKRGK